MPRKTYVQLAAVLLIAIASAGWTLGMGSGAWLPFGLLLLACIACSGLKVELPNSDGSMSATFPFLLIGIMILSPFQAMLLAALSVLAQRRKAVSTMIALWQLSFNIANAMIAVALAYAAFAGLRGYHMATAPALAIASVVYFCWNTGAVASVIASSTGRPPFRLWHEEFRWYLPFYILGAILASTANWLNVHFGWTTALLLVPAVYTVDRAYKSQIAQTRERKLHLEETEALHLRTIEGLSMAIEAKDQNTHDHLFRVRAYVQAVAEALQLDKLSMQALQTAAFLHDIGKLAVPEHIVNKPGKLTPEEFEKMKIHPVVGADILERVRFPYPVVPIVRSHHEWWDGSGYPDGISGEQIPIGARILTVVDCFDAMVSDRPYRKGMSNKKALGIIQSLSGTQFDPAVVAAFECCHVASELQAEAQIDSGFSALNTEIAVSRGDAPGAGFEAGSAEHRASKSVMDASSTREARLQNLSSLNLIAAASQEAQTLFEMSQSLGNSLSPEETVSVMASRLQKLVPYDLCVVYLRQGDALEPRFFDGEQARYFVPSRLDIGQGVSGWVAQSEKPLLNGNAGIEPGCVTPQAGVPALQSALSVPLFNLQQKLFAVLTLYSVREGSFERDHLRILQAMESKLSLSLSNALQFRRSETDAETDFLTSLPNARRLFLQLESEVERCRIEGAPLAIVVCDLNGFKDLNDSRGHLVGNRILSLVARELQSACEPGETVARMGGDEFVFLLPNRSKPETAGRLLGIRLAIESLSKRSREDIQISTSLGDAYYPEDGTSAEELLATADRRMYRDKAKFYESIRTEASLTGEAAPVMTA